MSNHRSVLGLMPTWVRGQARAEHGWIVLEATEEYGIFAEGGHDRMLPFELASVTNPRQAARFARRYGLLWSGVESVDHREKFVDWEAAVKDFRFTFQLLIAMDECQRGNTQDVDWLQYLHKRFFPPESHVLAIQDDDELLYDLSGILARQLSAGMRGTETGVLAQGPSHGEGPGLVLSVTAPSLLAYAYYQLSMLAIKKREVRLCLECGKPFPIKDKRQKFCDPACANRHRYQRWAEKQKVEG